MNTTCAYNITSGSPFIFLFPSKAPAPTVLHLTAEEHHISHCRYCHALLQGQAVLSQGCWAQGDGCSTPCTLSHLFPPSLLLAVTNPRLKREMRFCCCYGDNCNHELEWTNDDDRQAVTNIITMETAMTSSIRELVLMVIVVILVVMIVLLSALLRRQAGEHSLLPDGQKQDVRECLKQTPYLAGKGSRRRESLERLLEGGG